MSFERFDARVRERQRQFLDELRSLIALPTVSAQRSAIDETAAHVLERLRRAGARAEAARADGGPPTVLGEMGEGKRTLLVYNHFDVQPPEPLDEWQSPPFELTERDGFLFGRGVADNKGNLLARLQAIETYRETVGDLPLRIRFVYEGEEEIGSEHLAAFTDRHRERLMADGCIWEAGYKDAAGRPVISLGLKGIAYFELRVRSLAADAHSSYGTILPNPAWRLVWALSTLKTPDGAIAVDGLMEEVAPLTESDRALLERLPMDEEGMKRTHGVREFVGGISGTALKARHFFGPTCTICGLTSGYGGPGSKTVLPAVASAKLDFRLVPNLTPQKVQTLLRAHLDRRGFKDVEITPHHGEMPSRSPSDSDVAKASVAAARATYKTEPVVYPLMAGSGPMYQLCQRLGIPTTGFGVGNASSRAHGPNENVAVVDYLDHIRCFARFIHAFAGRPLE
jgi:acetylornithine deacetylase/succinyl-diaminopimelate desuccinylase-like protein